MKKKTKIAIDSQRCDEIYGSVHILPRANCLFSNNTLPLLCVCYVRSAFY